MYFQQQVRVKKSSASHPLAKADGIRPTFLLTSQTSLHEESHPIHVAIFCCLQNKWLSCCKLDLQKHSSDKVTRRRAMLARARLQGLQSHLQGIDLFSCSCCYFGENEGTDILVSPLTDSTKPMGGILSSCPSSTAFVLRLVTVYTATVQS